MIDKEEGKELVWELKQKIEEVSMLWLDVYEVIAEENEDLAREIDERWNKFLESLEKTGITID